MTPTTTANSVHFSPTAGTQLHLLQLLETCVKSIDAAQMEITAAELAQALISAKRRNLAVRLILDKHEGMSRGSRLRQLTDAGVNVRLADTFHIMHHKFVIIDAATIVTGSYNWSEDAEHCNAENMVTLYDQPQLAAAFQAEFDRLWQLAKPA